MQPKYVPIDSEKHKHLKVKASGNFIHAADDHLVLVNVREFVGAAIEFPIVFVKDEKSGEFVATLVMGLEAKENLFCDGSDWSCAYTPQILLNYPFSVALPSEESDQVAVLLDENSDLVDSIDGEDLFDESGVETQYLNDRAESVVRFIEEASLTKNFLKMLVDLDLIIKQDLIVKTGKESSQKIGGIYLVDEEKLNKLSDESFAKLRKSGSLPPIYAHLLSIRQINRVVQKKLETDN